jgi:hypothetical protein
MHENPYFHEILVSVIGAVFLGVASWLMRRLWNTFTKEFEATFGEMVGKAVQTKQFKDSITELTREAMANFAEGLVEQQIGLKEEVREIHKDLGHRIEMRHDALLKRIIDLHSDLVDADVIPANGHDFGKHEDKHD